MHHICLYGNARDSTKTIIKKNKTGGITLLKFRCYCKVMVIQIA